MGGHGPDDMRPPQKTRHQTKRTPAAAQRLPQASRREEKTYIVLQPRILHRPLLLHPATTTTITTTWSIPSTGHLRRDHRFAPPAAAGVVRGAVPRRHNLASRRSLTETLGVCLAARGEIPPSSWSCNPPPPRCTQSFRWRGGFGGRRGWGGAAVAVGGYRGGGRFGGRRWCHGYHSRPAWREGGGLGSGRCRRFEMEGAKAVGFCGFV